MLNVQIFDKISPLGLSIFKTTTYRLGDQFHDPDIILVRSHSLHDYPFLEQLKAIGRAGTGTDNIPVERLTELGVPVFYAPGANANAVKELILAAILIGYRHLDAARQFLCALPKEKLLAKEIEEQKKKFVGHEILGKTLGVIGLGNIGVKIANSALALGMHVVAYDPNMTLSNALALMPEVEKIAEMNEVFAQADVLTLHIPLTSKTTHLINKESIKAIKSGALLLNFSREAVVEEDAVIKQLNNQNLMGYITDFPTTKLLNHAKVLSFPHLGASTVEAEQNAAAKVIRNICNYIELGIVEDAVNFPNTLLTFWGQCYRMVIINRNMPGVIALITENISQFGYNIEQMVNTSRDKIAVNLIDISGPKGKLNALHSHIQKLPNIMRISILFP